jgi:hypothetical protein
MEGKGGGGREEGLEGELCDKEEYRSECLIHSPSFVVMLPRPDGAAASTLATSSSKRAREGREEEGQKEKWARILSSPTATPGKGDGKSPTIGSGKKAVSIHK